MLFHSFFHRPIKLTATNYGRGLHFVIHILIHRVSILFFRNKGEQNNGPYIVRRQKTKHSWPMKSSFRWEGNRIPSPAPGSSTHPPRAALDPPGLPLTPQGSPWPLRAPRGSQHPPLVLPVKQPAVLCDLHLQAGLEVQQHVVLLLVVGDVGVELGQLLLQAAHGALQPVQSALVAALGLRQRALQRRFLEEDLLVSVCVCCR